jgi:large subunit ribosomal protein L13
MTRTTLVKKEEVKNNWYLVDATDKTLGRMATKIAMMIMGKHKPLYTSHVDMGDFIIVVNAEKVKVTGNKLKEKVYKRFTGYSDGQKIRTMEEMMKTRPEQIVYLAVKRMVPSTKLGKNMITKLKVYKGETHPHKAQKIIPIEECAWWKYFSVEKN